MESREFEIVVPPGKVRERLDTFLARHVANATRSKVQHAVKGGNVLVNGKAVKSSHKISPGEIISVRIPTPAPPDILPENIPLDIVFEDDSLLVVNKPAGMVTHPAYANYTGTLVHALLHHCRDQLSTPGEQARPGIVHRLDKGTSGLLVVAKNDFVHAALAKQFLNHTIEREYWGVVWGHFEKGARSGTINAALGRSKSDRKKIAVTASGKEAVTEYGVLEEFGFCTLIRLRLHTGRTHQIRVHLHHVGHPVFGDPTYGGRRIAGGRPDIKEDVRFLMSLLTRQALHAKTLGFIHPVAGKPMRFDSDLPEDMKEVIDYLRKRGT
ncbi:MAG TPA: RluA family pseudouridine synthase [Bacteroidota bacterium]|nr:RluA family pseudouridine synthase [Bacteroidota bacterium]